MSQQQENAAPPRPPSNSHSDPSSYPSPPMQPSYAYPPPQAPPGNEPYRQSPTASNMPILPPIRGIDGQSQPPAQPPPPQGAQHLPPGQPMPGYPYGPPPGQPMIPGQVGSYQPQRYPLPAQNADARMLSGGRHKKEIKRRTKTGCLTCRKRRIKCDEQHPKCRNCIKSKRECLGYDPIFKQQQAPTQLQPAPNASPSSSSSAPVAGPTPTYPSSSAPYHPVSNGTSAPSATSASVKSEPSQPYEFGSAIDPALAGGGSTAMASSYGSSQFHPPPLVPCKVEDLWYFHGHRPTDVPPNPQALSQELRDEIKELYAREFAPGCNAILETDWYSKHGAEVLMTHSDLCLMMAELIKHYKFVGSGQNFAIEYKCRVFETMALWKLLCLARLKLQSLSSGANGTDSSQSPDIPLLELTRRLDVVEALVTNATISTNPLANLPYPPTLRAPKAREVDFWQNVGAFVTTPSDNTTRQGDSALSSNRSLLDMLENRDVLYSIMVCRHLGRRFQGFPDHLQSGRPEGGELDDGNKVLIARDFIMNEANWKGTSHPIQRLCDMAVRSWSIRP